MHNKSKQAKKIRYIKPCYFCKYDIKYINYKEVELLKKYINMTGQIKPRRLSNNCTRHQKRLAQAIKRSREVAFLPFEID